ncbi:hypothetical protein QCN29_24630 [Streptomyces sp. HNM0663]|uniref:LPXTG cell wall anchor domain-containing protein n=1 Tax=Streptomyces chengmaiensis TaxID=3040919 RepID=A0ABT6HUB8_9ACTN|nr:hypothetical protein [Streptomyces chengmaiensis]MDH2391907.1 hypothetical protein [Streptomyces chengmaiensis]
MSAARRPLLTATAAGTLLCALCFVPSANATAEQEAREAREAPQTAAQPQSAAAPLQARADAGSQAQARADAGSQAQARADAGSQAQAQAQERDLRLADTGSFDTTPYLLGGTALLTVGVGLVTYSVRRRPGTPGGTPYA